ncbi:Gfo/Idh/MocA family protein [Planctomicrobium piriforme]|uniref:Predicted dehydrogenase n=1 Tax=Planctomicrobium piriforme TaxID=1576369 RepID=A0A1I3QFC5_9PLAN|nr:Gfo/Idh/MocA family oxidoreductase [Planctomicrobium piriforme]SFJ32435.1 Predicted dehydrogenase [Planctomicrobium piriforme]
MSELPPSSGLQPSVTGSPVTGSSGTVNRRDFLGKTARNAAGVAVGVLSLGSAARKFGPNDQIQIGIIGAGAQGRELAQHLLAIPGVRITSLCDVDAHQLAAAQHLLHDHSDHRPVAVTGHEQLLQRSDVDAVVIATPDHWHAAICREACLAGKDVYLEQPVAHSVAQGQSLVDIAHKTGRIIQTGLPQRSGAHFQSAIELLRSGEIGRVHLAKAWAMHRRRSIGRVATAAAPVGVDYERWLGPAPARPFQATRFHQHWPCFWDYGSGELGQWGVQLLDIVRWGLNLDLPTRIAATGGNRAFHDDRETPDTLSVQFEFPELDVIWEHRQWSTRGLEGRTAAVAFYGDRGTLIVDRSGWKLYDGPTGKYADASELHQSHLANWLDCLRTRQTPTADIAVGQRSMTLCHLGNIAYRLGRELRFSPDSLTFTQDAAANRMLLGSTSAV